MSPFSFAEIKKRKLFQWSVTYLASGWVALQVLEYLGNSFHWPDSSKRIGAIVYVFGLICVLILSWFHGERGQQRLIPIEVALLIATIGLAGFTVHGMGAWSKTAAPVAASGIETNSIVVLPFANRSSNKQDEFFSDGISEEILDELARVPDLSVRARTSSFAFKNTQMDVPEIARRLKVRYVMEGSVQRSGDHVRISAQLIDANRDETVWNEQFESESKDVFAIEDDISRAIAEKLRLRLTDQGAGARTSSPEAHELYLRGRYLLAKSSEEPIRESWSYFERAIALDSTYAAAYGGLAEAYTLSAAELKSASVFDEARRLALRSLQLDEKQAEVHAVLGAILEWRDWDLTGAEREFKRAIALNPNSANTYDYYAWVYQARGDGYDAVRMTEEGVRLDPFSVFLNYALEFRYVNNGLYEKAIAQHKVTEALDPNQFYWDLPVAIAYREKHQYDDAVREYQRILQHLGPRPLHGLAVTYARMGKTAEARAILRQLELNAQVGYVPPEQLAMVYANLGENEQAFQWLEKAFADNDGWLMGWIVCDPAYAPLRSDPRYAQLVRRIQARYK